jgi:hypothetical protein
MNLKTWFKGLGVFVASSLITSLAAANLSPSTFNFSKQGLSKLAALAAIIGVKAVMLYLKQSPLPATNVPTNWSKVSGAFILMLALPAAGLISGCVNAWEQTTYATLATGKALIDCAVAGYNHADADIRHACAANPDDPAFDPSKFYIQQTRGAQQAIEKARQAQIACVEAFEGYAVAKLGKDKTVSLADKQAAVAGYLAQLPTLFNAVRALIGAAPASSRTVQPRESGNLLVAISNLRPDARRCTAAIIRPDGFRSTDGGDDQISRSPDSSPEVSLGQ